MQATKTHTTHTKVSFTKEQPTHIYTHFLHQKEREREKKLELELYGVSSIAPPATELLQPQVLLLLLLLSPSLSLVLHPISPYPSCIPPLLTCILINSPHPHPRFPRTQDLSKPPIADHSHPSIAEDTDMPDEDWDSYERKHRSGKSRKRGKFERDSSAGRRLVDADESRDYSSVAAGPHPFEKDLVDSAWERFDDTKGRGKRKGDRPENSWNDSGDIETATYEKNEMGKTSARKKQTRAAEPGETYEKDDKSKKLGIGRQGKTEREEWVDSRDIVDKGSDRAGVRARGDKPAPKAERGNSRDRIPLNLPDENWRDLEGSRKTSGDQKFGEKASFLLEAEDGVREETGGLHDDSVEDIAGDKTRREDFRRNIVGQSLSAEPNQARSKGRGASGNDYGSDRVVDRSTRWQRTDSASSPEWKEIGREKFRLGRAEKQGRIDSVDSERRWEEAEEAKLGSGSLGKEETDGKAGRWGRGKVENVREKQQEAWMEGDEPHSREAGSYLERRESRWDEPETVKRTWHGESEETMASMEFKRQRPRGRERLESVKGIFEDGSNPAAGGRDVRQLDRMEERHKRLKDAAESTKEDFEGWERFSERRRDGREDEDKLDRHRVGRDRGEIGWEVSEGRGRSISRMQDEEEESLIRSRPKDGHDFGWEELEDRRRSGGGRSGKSGRGVKRSWSPEGRRRGRVDHDEYDREWSDDMRDSERERGFRRDYDRDRESYRERERDAQRERDRDRDNFRNREMVREKDSDFLRDRDGARDREETDRWKSRQRDRQKERDDKNADGDYYDRDGWDVHKRDRDRPERSQRSGEEREWKEKAEVLRSPQISGNINDSLERVGGMHVNALDLRGERGLASNSPFLPGRGEGGGSFGDFFKSNNDADWMGTGPEERFRPRDWFSGVGNDSRERYTVEEEGPPGLDQNFGPSMNRVVGDGGMTFNIHGGRGRGPKGSPGHRGRGGQLGVDGRPPFPNNQGSGMMMRGMQQGGKGGRGRGGGKGGRGGVRDVQRGGGIPPLLMGPGPVPGPGPGPGMAPHFGPLGPAVPMPGMGPNMGPGPAPGMGPAGFPLPPFGGPGGWAGGRGGGEMGMLPGPPGSAPVPTPGPAPRFVPNMGPSPGPNVFFSPPGPGRGAPSGMPGSAFGGASFGGRGMVVEKVPMGRVVPRISAPAGRAPSRGEQNDYSQHFVDTGLRPQNFIRDVDVSDRFEEYPKLKELITRKDKLIAEHACPPMYLQCDLRTSELSSELFGTKFDVILVDPPWEEYIRRAPGVGDSMEWWSYEDIQNLRIEAIADTPSFIFLWVGDAEGLDQGRLCLKKWGFRRCEDICWVKTNRENPTPALRHDASTLLQHSKEHCLMGIKGTVRRSTDGHVIHANIDTDIIISEEPPYGSTAKPEELYHIIEHFAQGQRRLELFGEDHNIRAGWVTAGKGLSSSNFNPQTYVKYFADSDGKVWQGGRGNPPADAPHLVGTTPEIEALRPKSPPPRAQQQQQSQAGNSASQPSAANLNTMKAPTASQGVVTQSAQTAQNLAIQGSGQANPTSSVIVINSTSTIQGSGVGRNAGNVQIAKPRRSPMRSTIKPAGPGSVVADGPEEEKSVGGDGQESIADKEAQRHVEPPTEVVL